MAEQKATNVFWHEGDVTREDRASLLKQKGATLWFTGLSGSGKSTVAVALEKALLMQGRLSYRLDGDNVRLGINKNLGFSAEDRTENIRRVGEVSKLMADAGILAHRSMEAIEPATIVLPTGTGKTETMLAAFAKHNINRVIFHC